MPWWYAPAWRDFPREVYICMPMGLHLLARWARDCWFWLHEVGLPGYRQRVEHAAYMAGIQKRRASTGRVCPVCDGEEFVEVREKVYCVKCGNLVENCCGD